MQHGRDPCNAAPLQRWDTDQLHAPDAAPGKAYTRFGSFLASVEAFDASLFKLPRAEAVPMDPHARLLLESTQVPADDACVPLGHGPWTCLRLVACLCLS